ncbi:MAG: OsmC family protein [Actinomycetota bacterium]|nr:OsmC family protein [Actinomycetota bacterium]
MTFEARPVDLPSEKPAHRTTTLTRRGLGAYTAMNARGGTIPVAGGDDEFTPVELLLAGIAACTAVDVDHLTSRRAEPDDFEIRVDAHKVGDEQGNHLEDIVVTFRIRYPEGEGGDRARAVLPDIVKKSHDRLCTVGRTVELGTEIRTVLE